jgi:hypothetical protein
VLGVEVGRAVEKQRGDTTQGFRPLLGRAVLDNFFELGQQRGWGSHSSSWKTPAGQAHVALLPTFKGRF